MTKQDFEVLSFYEEAFDTIVSLNEIERNPCLEGFVDGFNGRLRARKTTLYSLGYDSGIKYRKINDKEIVRNREQLNH
jgi:hypothetical protein